MTYVEPIPGEPAASVDLGGAGRGLLVADYHAGFESALRYELGIELRSRGPDRRERLLALIDRVDPDRLIMLGDVTHSIGEPRGAERGELEVLLESIDRPVTIVKGNHDGALETWMGEWTDGGRNRRIPSPATDLTVTDAGGIRLGDVGFVHGHGWPNGSVASASRVCVGHEHPCVRLVDEVGGRRIEPVWVRGRMDRRVFESRLNGIDEGAITDGGIDGPELVLVPAFNRGVGGTWVNVADRDFLSPFLPAALEDGDVYLLDGTRLGPYDSV